MYVGRPFLQSLDKALGVDILDTSGAKLLGAVVGGVLGATSGRLALNIEDADREVGFGGGTGLGFALGAWLGGSLSRNLCLARYTSEYFLRGRGIGDFLDLVFTDVYVDPDTTGL